MNYFANIVRRIGGLGIALGNAFLVGITVLIVANVIVRSFGPTIKGTYELVELMLVVLVVFALVYTALAQRHIVIRFLVSRLPQQAQAVSEIITHIISLGFWAVLVWASVELMLKRWLAEQSQVLGIVYLPFRFVWVFGLSLLCLVFLIDLYKVLSKVVRK